MKLEIGGGLATWPGFTNLDPVHGEGMFRRRIQDGIPLPDCSVEAARCSHLMEHIPAGQERVDAFNEVWRVLIPHGMFEVVVPEFDPADPDAALCDPMHVSLWRERSFDYFTGAWQGAADEGIFFWELAERERRRRDWGPEVRAVLRKPA